MGWSYLAAKEAALVDRVVLSCDCQEWLDRLNHIWGTEGILRPPELATDGAPLEGSITHALGVLAEEGYRPTHIVVLQPTSPMRGRGEVDACLQAMMRLGADSIFSASRVHGFVWRGDTYPRALTYDPAKRPNRQDAPADWLEDGAIYCTTLSQFANSGNRIGGRVAVWERPHPMLSWQIDTQADWDVVRALWQTHKMVERLPHAR